MNFEPVRGGDKENRRGEEQIRSIVWCFGGECDPPLAGSVTRGGEGDETDWNAPKVSSLSERPLLLARGVRGPTLLSKTVKRVLHS